MDHKKLARIAWGVSIVLAGLSGALFGAAAEGQNWAGPIAVMLLFVCLLAYGVGNDINKGIWQLGNDQASQDE